MIRWIICYKLTRNSNELRSIMIIIIISFMHFDIILRRRHWSKRVTWRACRVQYKCYCKLQTVCVLDVIFHAKMVIVSLFILSQFLGEKISYSLKHFDNCFVVDSLSVHSIFCLFVCFCLSCYSSMHPLLPQYKEVERSMIIFGLAKLEITLGAPSIVTDQNVLAHWLRMTSVCN